MKASLERRADNFDPSLYWSLHPLQPAVIAHNNIAKAEAAAAISAMATEAQYNMYKGDPYSRQLEESVEAFLARLPPQTTDTCEWIRIGNPQSTFRHTSEDRKGFIAEGAELLNDFTVAKADIESATAGKAKAAITRKLKPLQQKLEGDLFLAAKARGCQTGKWMMFPSPDNVNSAWSKVAKATANNELGLAAKVAAVDPNEANANKARLICVYTEDFGDKADVKRVCEKLLALGLVNRSGAMGNGDRIYYKADAYTYLDIMGGNEWGLKASMFSSKDILAKPH